jgi:hypothetical protein
VCVCLVVGVGEIGVPWQARDSRRAWVGAVMSQCNRLTRLAGLGGTITLHGGSDVSMRLCCPDQCRLGQARGEALKKALSVTVCIGIRGNRF